jgi:hypothetical protein
MTTELGGGFTRVRAEYSGDSNYLPSSSSDAVYYSTAAAVSPSDSLLTIRETGRGFEIEVQLRGVNGEGIAFDASTPPQIEITASRGVPERYAYRGNGRYTSFVEVTREEVEVLTISASISGRLIGSIAFGPVARRQRTVR